MKCVVQGVFQMPKGGGDKPTPMQRQAVDGVLSGKFKKVRQAMRDAGYTEASVHNADRVIGKAKGVEAYLRELGGEAMKRWHMSIQEKVMSVYMDGLDAKKLYGKDAIEYPDHLARKAFADRFAEFFGWVQTAQLSPGSRIQQFNFFGIADEKRKEFNTNFNKFLDRYYR